MDGEPETIKIVCCEAAFVPETFMAPIIAFWSPPPSIGLDGEPETIKEFAAKQHSTMKHKRWVRYELVEFFGGPKVLNSENLVYKRNFDKTNVT